MSSRRVVAMVAVLATACGSSKHHSAPPVVESPLDVTGLAIAVYAPPEAFRDTLADQPLPRPARTGVAVFGDSLTVQAWDYLTQLARYGGHSLTGGRLSGSSLCDWMDDIGRILTQVQPAYVVLAFAGNVRPCTGEDKQLREAYERDARAVVTLAGEVGTRVVLVGPPDMKPVAVARNSTRVRKAFSLVASEDENVDYVDSRGALSPDGFTFTLGCESHERAVLGCDAGEIQVRLADGVHLSQPDAHGYSGGSWRWATSLLSTVRPAARSPAAND